MSQPHQDALLDRHLHAWLGDIDDAALALLRARLEWCELGAGEVLMTEGEPGDSMYLQISGRLRAYVRDAGGQERMVREMERGQVVGEMALFTREPRSATVVAIRDSVLVRLDEAAFRELLAASPAFSLAITRQTVQRLRAGPAAVRLARPAAIALVPITAGVDAPAFAAGLATPLATHGRTLVVDAARLDAELGEPGIARRPLGDREVERRITLRLDALEAEHDHLLLLADADDSPWTERCCRRADELLLLADATQPPALHASEQRFLVQRSARAEAAEVLVLLHAADTPHPRGTRAWLDRRPLAGHLHVRPALERDMARLARIESRNAVGLVLAGGGARGIAHLGVYRALQEQGIEVDVVGGTSIGAVMATLVAADRPVAEVTAIARRAFAINPTGDYNVLPLLSLISGRRLRRAIDGALHALFGEEPQGEDLWKSWFVVASNFSKAREEVLRRGPVGEAVRASLAIPGALPPVLKDGDLLCDGGTFNNFPVDLMRAHRGVGRVIGVDLAVANRGRLGTEVPSSWALLLDRLRPRRRRRWRFPSLVSYLMNITILYSQSRQREARQLCDVYLNPPLPRVGMLQWSRFDHIVEQGLRHGREVLKAAAPVENTPHA